MFGVTDQVYDKYLVRYTGFLMSLEHHRKTQFYAETYTTDDSIESTDTGFTLLGGF